MSRDRTVNKKSEAATARPRFLLIGDDKQVSQALHSVLEVSYDLTQAPNPTEALRALAQHGADVVLVDTSVLASSMAPIGHRSDRTATPVVSMAVDLQAVKVVGEMLKALAKARSRVIN
jgi:DNA-binding NtrC family response regulator